MSRSTYRSTDLVATMPITMAPLASGAAKGPKRSIARNCALRAPRRSEGDAAGDLEASSARCGDAARAYIKRPAGQPRRIRKQTLVQFGRCEHPKTPFTLHHQCNTLRLLTSSRPPARENVGERAPRCGARQFTCTLRGRCLNNPYATITAVIRICEIPSRFEQICEENCDNSLEQSS